MKPSRRRRGFLSWFVEPYRQVKLGLMFLTLNFVFAGLFFLVFGYYFLDVYQTLAEYFRLSEMQSHEVLSKFYPPIIIGAALLLVFISLTILLSVMYTHRIYGPLVSIHRFLDEVLENQRVKPLVLRESDQLQELAEKLNLLAEKLAQHKELKTEYDLRDNEDESAS